MSKNRLSFIRVAYTLRPLLGEIVFVGGHIPSLLTNEPGTRIRPTTDVDIVAAITTRTQYRQFCTRLKALGLREDTRDGAPICRWITNEGDVVDVMPLAEEVLSFSNPWYVEAMATAFPYTLEADTIILLPSAAAFLATKFAAYHGRGDGDLLESHDIEDIIVVVAGRSTIVGDVAAASLTLRNWLSGEVQNFLSFDSAIDAVTGALPDARVIPTLVDRTMDRLQQIASL